MRLGQLRSTDRLYSDIAGDMINVALPKGRLGQKVYDMFERAGYPCPEKIGRAHV